MAWAQCVASHVAASGLVALITQTKPLCFPKGSSCSEPGGGKNRVMEKCILLLAARCSLLTALGEQWARATAHKRIRSLRFGEKTLFFQMKPPPGLRKPVVAQPQSHPGTTSLGNGVRPARAACGAASARGGEGRTQAGPEGHLGLLWSPRFAHVGKCGPW